MKKLIYAFSTFVLVLSSCSSDSDSSTTTPEGTLLKKIIETDPDGDVTTTNFTYSTGNKLEKISYSDGSHDDYTYTGDLITQVKIYSDASTLDQTETYEYNSDNKLVAYITKYHLGDAPLFAAKIVYVYNGDGTISFTSYTGTHDAQTDFFEDGKHYESKFDLNVVINGVTHLDTHTYTLDAKNSPWKNITGLGKIWFAGSEEGFNYTQNITSILHTNSLGTVETTYDSTFTYNSNNYAVTQTETSHIDAPGEDAVYTYQYFYE